MSRYSIDLRWGPFFAGLLLAACGPPPDPVVVEPPPRTLHAGPDEDIAEAADGRPPTPTERRVIDELARDAEQVRDLRFLEPVTVRIQDRATIVSHLFEELEDEDLEKSRIVYVALGLLPDDMNVRELLERVLGEQVVGYYDHERDRLVIRDDVMARLRVGAGGMETAETRVTIVHELVHALQDQRLRLGEQFDDEERDSDPDSAYHAVVEGDATLAMVAYLLGDAGAPIESVTHNAAALRAMMESDRSGDEELGRAPAILRVTLLSSYLDGLLFSARLHKDGGWRAIDAAHLRPPVSTEQVLHPEKYFRGELPDPVELPELRALTDAGLTVFDEDRLGELEMRVYFGQRTDDVDEASAAGWSGDRLRVYRDDSGTASVVWFTAWDDASEAQQAEAAARQLVDGIPQAERDRFRVHRRGRAVLILRHLPPALHAPVVAEFDTFADALPLTPPRRPPSPP